jgi:hypothetical protein
MQLDPSFLLSLISGEIFKNTKKRKREKREKRAREMKVVLWFYIYNSITTYRDLDDPLSSY